MGSELQEALRFLADLRTNTALWEATSRLHVMDWKAPALYELVQRWGYQFDPLLLPKAYDIELRMRRAAYTSPVGRDPSE